MSRWMVVNILGRNGVGAHRLVWAARAQPATSLQRSPGRSVARENASSQSDRWWRLRAAGLVVRCGRSMQPVAISQRDVVSTRTLLSDRKGRWSIVPTRGDLALFRSVLVARVALVCCLQEKQDSVCNFVRTFSQFFERCVQTDVTAMRSIEG